MVALALATLEEETPSLRPKEWTTHSQDLLYDNQKSHANTVFTNDFDETGNLSDDEILGELITPKEIHEQISKLKTKKASGMDSILNEMIKHGRHYLLPSKEKNL